MRNQLQPDHLTVTLTGSAGQSLGAFAAPGLKLEVAGDANDYVGKGLSGGSSWCAAAGQPAEGAENTIIGNTVLYGATDGLPLRLGPGRRTLRRAQLRREGRGRGLRLQRVRIHDRRRRRDPRASVGDNFGAGMTGGMAYLIR
jgi:glutamate synthase (NADPH/NADH) large chain